LTLVGARAIIEAGCRHGPRGVPFPERGRPIAKPTVAFRVALPRSAEDSVAEALWELGTDGFQAFPAGDDTAILLAYFSNGIGRDAIARGLASVPQVSVEPADVPDVDWVARFRQGFRPFAAGGFLVVPAWEPTPAEDRSLVVDPGQAFGTGTHESTRLCLAALERLASARPLGRVLDVGTGTGILAIAAARLGAARVTAVDLDPASMESARHHAQLNHVRIELVRGDGGRPFAGHGFDVVLANLTCRTLLERRAELAAVAAARARLVLAGFLAEDVPSLRGAYGELGAVDVSTDGEWAAAVVETTGALSGRDPEGAARPAPWPA
jgi:ribosomal protein L11 methyltransferase